MNHKHVFVSAKGTIKFTKQTVDPKVEIIISGTQWLHVDPSIGVSLAAVYITQRSTV